MSLGSETIRSMHGTKTIAPAVAAVAATKTEEPGRDDGIGAGTLPEIYGEGDANFL